MGLACETNRSRDSSEWSVLHASDIGIGSLSVPFSSMYASAKSCVDRLNTEGGRDSASVLTQTADKRRKGATPAETLTGEQKQERLKKRGER